MSNKNTQSAQIRTLLSYGTAPARIAELLGCSVATVCNVRRDQARGATATLRRVVQHARQYNRSVATIATLTGLSYNHVYTATPEYAAA